MEQLLRFEYGVGWDEEKETAARKAVYDFLSALNVGTAHDPSCDSPNGHSCYADIGCERFIPIISDAVQEIMRIMRECEQSDANIGRTLSQIIAHTRRTIGFGTAGYFWEDTRIHGDFFVDFNDRKRAIDSLK